MRDVLGVSALAAAVMYLYRKDGITRLSIALWYSPMQVLTALGWLVGIAIGWWLGRP